MVSAGPWGSLIRKAVKTASNKMGKQVRHDVTQAQRRIKVDHSNDYTDLAQDSRLSPEWIDKLIDRSKHPGQLGKLAEYMTNDEKTANLGSARRFLLKKLAQKVRMLHDESEFKFNTTTKELTKVIEHLADYLF